MITQPQTQEDWSVENPEVIDMFPEGLRSSSEDHKTHNWGKEGRFVIKQIKEEYK